MTNNEYVIEQILINDGTDGLLELVAEVCRGIAKEHAENGDAIDETQYLRAAKDFEHYRTVRAP